MAHQYNRKLGRAISMADFILEDNGHSVTETALEFKSGQTTVLENIRYLGSIAFYGNEPNEKELKIKYLKVKKTLDRLAKEHNPNNISKYNASKKVVSN